MPSTTTPVQYLQNARISPEVAQMRPDYRALLVVIENIPPGGSDAQSEALLVEAESTAKKLLVAAPVTELPHISAWREAYKSLGAKQQKIRNSLESLTRRVDAGLPRVNRLTDIYNAISVKHQIPLDGEDLDQYSGAPFLIRAKGDEKFETKSGGEVTIEHPSEGEFVSTMLESHAGAGTGVNARGRRSRTTQRTLCSFWMPSIRSLTMNCLLLRRSWAKSLQDSRRRSKSLSKCSVLPQSDDA